MSLPRAPVGIHPGPVDHVRADALDVDLLVLLLFHAERPAVELGRHGAFHGEAGRADVPDQDHSIVASLGMPSGQSEPSMPLSLRTSMVSRLPSTLAGSTVSWEPVSVNGTRGDEGGARGSRTSRGWWRFAARGRQRGRSAQSTVRHDWPRNFERDARDWRATPRRMGRPQWWRRPLSPDRSRRTCRVFHGRWTAPETTPPGRRDDPAAASGRPVHLAGQPQRVQARCRVPSHQARADDDAAVQAASARGSGLLD